MFSNKIINLPPYSRGIYLITNFIENNLPVLPQNGMLNLFILHTSAAICITENTDPDVLTDMELMLSKLVPDAYPAYKHIAEGIDDMSAHIKTALIGVSLNIPIVDYRINLGTWQGICLCEFRNELQNRKILASIWGE
jgi:secondary thiamine-phosphate synthase enzyme